MRNKITKVCIIDSAYTLLLYLLMSSCEEINKTFFFVGDGIHADIRKNLPLYYTFHKNEIENRGSVKIKLLYLNIRIKTFFIWSFLRKAKIYGHDHLWFSAPLIGFNKITVIEDGTANYQNHNNIQNKDFISKFIYGPIMYTSKWGSHKWCEKVILTGRQKTSFSDSLNSIVISPEKCWEQASNEKQQLILRIFNITKEDIKELSSKPYILFTQCLSEDNIMSEGEKIKLYREMLKDVNPKDLVIKIHPRETTDYTKYFPDCYIFTKRVPMQLLSFAGIKFIRSYTVCSNAALDFDYPIENIFLGSEIHPNIARAYGVIRLSQ